MFLKPMEVVLLSSLVLQINVAGPAFFFTMPRSAQCGQYFGEELEDEGKWPVE